MTRTLREIIASRESEPGFRETYEAARRAVEIGDQVRSRRLALGMSQSELARKACTSRSAIARIEMGDGDPRMFTLRRVGHALGVELVIDFRDPVVA